MDYFLGEFEAGRCSRDHAYKQLMLYNPIVHRESDDYPNGSTISECYETMVDRPQPPAGCLSRPDLYNWVLDGAPHIGPVKPEHFVACLYDLSKTIDKCVLLTHTDDPNTDWLEHVKDMANDFYTDNAKEELPYTLTFEEEWDEQGNLMVNIYDGDQRTAVWGVITVHRIVI